MNLKFLKDLEHYLYHVLIVKCGITKLAGNIQRELLFKSCPAEVLISAAKSLAEAYFALGDNRNAYTFMNITISLAKNQNSSKDYITNLEEKLKLYSSSN